MIRIAVIGAGAHSSRCHGPALRHVAAESPAAVELAAVCDLDVAKADRYAMELGFGAVYDDYRAMLEAESLDGLVVVTPVAVTREVVGDLLPRGIPLLIEKPPGVNSDEARELLAAADARDAPHMISFNRRFSPAVVRARQWLAANAADRPPELAIARMLRVDRRDRDFVTSTAIHAADTVLAFMARPVEVAARRWETPIAGGEPAQSCGARIRFADGAAAMLAIAPGAGVYEETYELLGPEYCVRIDTARCTVSIFERGREALHWEAPPDTPPCVRHGAVGETEAFVEAIAGQRPYHPTLTEGLASIIVAERMDGGNEIEVSAM